MFKRFFKNLSLSTKTALVVGVIVGILFIVFTNKALKYTSTDAYCQSCHVHPHAEFSWKQSPHYTNKSGVQVHCVECHLPPEGLPYLREKVKTGLRDIWVNTFTDTKKIDWESKSKLEHAVNIVYKESCVRCHQNLFTKGLSREGEDAHLYYSQHERDLECVNCHLNVGHYNRNAMQAKNKTFGLSEKVNNDIFTEATKILKFENFTEKIPGSSVSFDMVAIPGGEFVMGSHTNESFRKTDEDATRKVKISPFYMGKIEVTWDEYLTFLKYTTSEGRLNPTKVIAKNSTATSVDAISGPTAPYGYPDQGWGKGRRPAISMSYYAAETYVKWLSMVTGKKYRLPTEAEWEYAARANTNTPYFFEGSPEKYSNKGFWRKIFAADTSVISQYVVYKLNSKSKTQEPSFVKANKFGLKNMLGNVREFCSDWYSADYYAKTSKLAINPCGPEVGTERVVRGGSYKSDASEVRSAARDFTQSAEWLKTDPQMPKSIWWYSDANDVGFRVVCEVK